MSMFTRATKEQRKARIFLSGPSGCGKTWTALTWARVLGEKIALIDTEHGSALAYADDFAFDHANLVPPFTVARYEAAIAGAVDAGYDCLVIDSLSHAWAGKGGLLEQVDNYGRTHRGDSFGAWRDVTPQHQSFIEAMISAPLHLIATARAKQEYQMQQNERGKWEPVRLGLAPVQRDGLDYEFDVVGELTVPENTLTITKTRCSALSGYVEMKPDAKPAEILRDWLTSGRPQQQEERPTVQEMYDTAIGANYDVLLGLYKTAERFHMLSTMVKWPNSEEELTIGDLIKRLGQEAKQMQEAGV
jgi:hypothetical protein